MAKKSHTGHRPAPQQAKGAARKPQAPAGAASSATLVRPPSLTDSAPVSSASAPATPSASNVVADTPVATPSAAKSASSSGAARPVAPKPAAAATARRAAVAERPAATATSPAPKPPAPKPPAPKPAAPKAAAPKPAAAAPKPAAPRPQATAISTREQNQRLARARATQRARQANLISAESYSYVLGDLKLIVGLAVSALIVLVALTFVLPH